MHRWESEKENTIKQAPTVVAADLGILRTSTVAVAEGPWLPHHDDTIDTTSSRHFAWAARRRRTPSRRLAILVAGSRSRGPPSWWCSRAKPKRILCRRRRRPRQASSSPSPAGHVWRMASSARPACEHKVEICPYGSFCDE
jgi:hypothetical protein